MAKRFTDTDLWEKEWFMKLSAKHKCLTRFIYDRCDVVGVWSPNWTMASMFIGEKVSADDLSAIDEGNQFEVLENGKIFIPDFCEFQYGQLTEKCKPHLKYIRELKKHGLFERVSKGYTKGIHTLEEKDKEKEKEKEKDFGKSENLLTEDQPSQSFDPIQKIESELNEIRVKTPKQEQIIKRLASNELNPLRTTKGELLGYLTQFEKDRKLELQLGGTITPRQNMQKWFFESFRIYLSKSKRLSVVKGASEVNYNKLPQAKRMS